MTKKQRREIAEIFYAAAESIETNNDSFCCVAIKRRGLPICYIANQIFDELFMASARDLGNHRYGCWFQELKESSDDPKVRARRVFGLVLAAHLVLEGEIG